MALLKKLKHITPGGDFLHLVFPNACLACARELSRHENYLCSFCTAEIVPTRFHQSKEPTPMDQLFWGRVPVRATYAHIQFEKQKAAQHLLFTLKYRDTAGIGVHYGKEIGRTLQNTVFANADALIPVPLHPRKEFIRGYNQSKMLATGIAETLGVPVDDRTVSRTRHTASQTRKSRFQRWDNVHGIFQIRPAISGYQHVVLVDDVITTGSTLESLVHALQEKHPSLSVSVITLAIA